MKKHKKGDSFIKKPFYKGGNTELSKFIYGNLKYPKEAQINKIEGIVRLKVSIDHTGQVNGSKITSGIGFGCDEEAQRVIELLKFEVPKNPKKLKINFFKNMKVQFKVKPPAIEDKKMVAATDIDIAQNQPKVNYQYTIASESTKASKPSKDTVITYTIKY